MSKSFMVAMVVLALCAASYAQRPWVPHHYMLHATISHHAGTATVKADAADPLADAITAVSEEYGWVVDYEDPPYSGTDLTIHPSVGPGLQPYTIVAGGAFQSTYPEAPSMGSSRAAELTALEKIVSDYNASGNPGDFTVMSLPDGNYDVVGISTRDNSGGLVSVKPLLSTIISIPSEPRDISGVVGAIFSAVGVKRLAFFCPTCAAVGAAKITVGGSNVPARDILMQIADLGDVAVGWSLVYDPTPTSTYDFGLGPAERAEYNSFGQKTLVPVLRTQ
ncbi:MAG: hypothetical protein ACRD2B_13980 [Terriglobia bacterium]